jgi:hypothetical protein
MIAGVFLVLLPRLLLPPFGVGDAMGLSLSRGYSMEGKVFLWLAPPLVALTAAGNWVAMRARRCPRARLASLLPGVLAPLAALGFALAISRGWSGPGFPSARPASGARVAGLLGLVFVVVWLLGMICSGLLAIIGGARSRRMVSTVGFGFGVAAMAGFLGALLCGVALQVAITAEMTSGSYSLWDQGQGDRLLGIGSAVHQLVPVIAGMLLIYAGYAAVWMGALREPAERPPLDGPDPAHRLPGQAATASASGGSRSP